MSGELILSYDDGARHDSVAVAGEFSGWNPSPMHLESGTKYSAKFTQGIHAGHDYMYKFVVDGEWKLLEGHTTRTDLDGNVNHAATATIVESGHTTAATTVPGVVPVPVQKSAPSDHHNLKDIKEHDRLRAQFLAQELNNASHRTPRTDDEEIAKAQANLGGVNRGFEEAAEPSDIPYTPSTPKNVSNEERENISVKDIYEENDIPPATDPDSTIGSAYTPDKSWGSPAPRTNAEVVDPSGVSTPPRMSHGDEVSDVTMSPESKNLATPASKAAAAATSGTPSKPTKPVAAAPPTAGSATTSDAKSASGAAAAKAASGTTATAKTGSAQPAAAGAEPTTPEKKEKPAKQRSSLRKFFRKLMD